MKRTHFAELLNSAHDDLIVRFRAVEKLETEPYCIGAGKLRECAVAHVLKYDGPRFDAVSQLFYLPTRLAELRLERRELAGAGAYAKSVCGRVGNSLVVTDQTKRSIESRLERTSREDRLGSLILAEIDMVMAGSAWLKQSSEAKGGLPFSDQDNVRRLFALRPALI